MSESKRRRILADQWAGHYCRLDGYPARVVGRLNQFATIAPESPQLPAVEFAWLVVDRVMRDRGGNFVS